MTIPSPMPILIKGASILSMDSSIGDFDHGDVLVQDGVIARVAGDLQSQDAQLIDGGGAILIPGLIDTHLHCWNALFRGLPIGPDYFRWKRRIGPAYLPSDTRAAARLVDTMAIESGVTTVNDWAHNVRSPEDADASLDGHRSTGLRIKFSYGTPEGLDKGLPMDLSDLDRVAGQVGGGHTDLISVGVSLRGPTRSDPEVSKREWQHARDRGLLITTHSGLMPSEVSKGTYIETLQYYGMLGQDVTLVHALDATDGDLELIKTSGSNLSIAPAGNLRGGGGIPPHGPLRAAGVTVSLSHDWVGANRLDMFEVMRAAYGLARLRGPQASYRDVLAMATLSGARALGLDAVIGSITPGKRADLVLLRPDVLQWAPFMDAVEYVVGMATPRDVDLVVVDGRILLRDGALTSIERAAVAADARRSTQGLLDRTATPIAPIGTA